MHVGSATLMIDHLDWEHVFIAGLTQAPIHILVQITLSAVHLNFSPGFIWARNRCLLAQWGAQAKAKVLLKGGLWTSNSAMQPCRAQPGTGNGCKVLREWKTLGFLPPGWRMPPAGSADPAPMGLRPSALVFQLEEKLVPLLEVSTLEAAAPQQVTTGS